MAIPFRYIAKIGAYLVKQHLLGVRRYPLVLMMEPLFRCNLACAGCGKIDYPDHILNKRLSVEDALRSVDECGAPVVVVAGGEPLLHKDLPQIVEGIVARRKFAIVCTNALLLAKKIDHFKPSPYFTWSIHLDGDKEMHDRAVCQDGVYERAVEALKLAKSKGFRVTTNSTFFSDADPERVAKFLDATTALGVDGMTLSPGYAYERAPDQTHFLNRTRTKELFRAILRRGRGGKAWGLHPVDAVHEFSGRQCELSLHPLGDAAAHGVWLAASLLSARRRLCADVQAADGGDRLGRLRRRQLREMRRLHGALRL